MDYETLKCATDSARSADGGNCHKVLGSMYGGRKRRGHQQTACIVWYIWAVRCQLSDQKTKSVFWPDSAMCDMRFERNTEAGYMRSSVA